MSQHNIMGSEAFTKGPFVIIRAVKSGGFRRRRSRSLAAYVVVAVVALSAGAAVAAFALGPLLVQAEPASAAAPAMIAPTPTAIAGSTPAA